MLSDGYKWKYLFTTSIGDTNRFLTTDFIPVRKIEGLPDAADLAGTAQKAVQDTAKSGAIYNIKLLTAGDDYTPTIVTYTVNGIVYPNAAKIVSDPSAGPVSGELDVKVMGNGSGTIAFATMVMETVDDVLVPTGSIEDIIIQDPGLNYEHVEVNINGSGGTGATARGVLGPAGGFGADPRRDLRAHYVGLNKVFQGTDNLPNTNDFRQIGIIKNPMENVIGGANILGIDDSYIGTNMLVVPAGLESYYLDDLTIIGTVSGAKANIVTYDNSTGIIYYSQDEITGYTPFRTDDVIRNNDDTSGGSTLDTVMPMIESTIARYSGQVLFVENRLAVTRGADQLETIRLVLAF